MAKNRAFKLDDADVGMLVNSGSTADSCGPTNRFDRKLRTTYCSITLNHYPTGLKVSGDIPVGHYSKNEMRKLQDQVKQKLMIELTALVAKHLHVKGT